MTETFTATGTWTRPYGVDRVRVLCVSGGGSGMSGTTYAGSPSGWTYNGGGGGGGGLVDAWVDVASQRSLTVTVGAAGTGNSSFGTLLSTWRGGSANMTHYAADRGSAVLAQSGGSAAVGSGEQGISGTYAVGQGNQAGGGRGGGAGGTSGQGYTAWNGVTYAAGGLTGSTTPAAGAANTGNGGDGGFQQASPGGAGPYSGMAGGSGIVLVGYWI